LAAYTVKTKRPNWINDYQEYQRSATKEGKPVGYSDPKSQSVAHIPLMFEMTVYGSLSIDSFNSKIRWEDDGYKEPLLALSELVTLVVRDLTLDEEIERKTRDLAAMIAYSINTSRDAIWRHWVIQRLAEASGVAYNGTVLIETGASKKNLKEAFMDIERIIETISQGRPSSQMEDTCSIKDVLHRIGEKYHRIDKPKLILELPNKLPDNLLRLAIPIFHIQNILQILIDNAIQAIRESKIGTKIIISIAKIGDRIAEIEVRNDGPGLPENFKSMILKEPIQSSKGSGVGLLIARGTALQYRGDLILSPTDTGVCFKLSLPIFPRQ
jgi:signal transduction histidine kinase